MLDWEFTSDKSLPFLANTDSSSLCAPQQQYHFVLFSPLDTEELPPELTLDHSGWSAAKDGWGSDTTSLRRRSIDQPYSILGFIERKISDRRGRVNS
jgi:hypothetical protein